MISHFSVRSSSGSARFSSSVLYKLNGRSRAVRGIMEGNFAAKHTELPQDLLRACSNEKGSPGYEKGLILHRERTVRDNVHKPALGID